MWYVKGFIIPFVKKRQYDLLLFIATCVCFRGESIRFYLEPDLLNFTSLLATPVSDCQGVFTGNEIQPVTEIWTDIILY